MNKTPDEIKKGLEYLSIKDVVKKLDAWKEGIAYDYAEDAAADALALIQRLEAENDQQAMCIENLTDKLNAAHDEAAKLQAERDAAVALIPHACAYCKWYGTKHGGFFPDCKNPSGCKNISGINTGWEWRGVQKEGNNAT